MGDILIGCTILSDHKSLKKGLCVCLKIAILNGLLVSWKKSAFEGGESEEDNGWGSL